MTRATAKPRGTTLLIAKLDRLARNVAFIANLLESGVKVVAINMPETNTFMLHVMAAVAEPEATAHESRTTAGQGVWCEAWWLNPRHNDGPKGCQHGKPNADVVALQTYPTYVKRPAQGHCDAKDMADTMNAHGVRSARGGIWHTSSVKNLEARLFDMFDGGCAREIVKLANSRSPQ